MVRRLENHKQYQLCPVPRKIASTISCDNEYIDSFLKHGPNPSVKITKKSYNLLKFGKEKVLIHLEIETFIQFVHNVTQIGLRKE